MRKGSGRPRKPKTSRCEEELLKADFDEAERVIEELGWEVDLDCSRNTFVFSQREVHICLRLTCPIFGVEKSLTLCSGRDATLQAIDRRLNSEAINMPVGVVGSKVLCQIALDAFRRYFAPPISDPADVDHYLQLALADGQWGLAVYLRSLPTPLRRYMAFVVEEHGAYWSIQHREMALSCLMREWVEIGKLDEDELLARLRLLLGERQHFHSVGLLFARHMDNPLIADYIAAHTAEMEKFAEPKGFELTLASWAPDGNQIYIPMQQETPAQSQEPTPLMDWWEMTRAVLPGLAALSLTLDEADLTPVLGEAKS